MFVSLWRTMILFFLVTVAMRFMGKRQLGELKPSELVTTIMISNIAAIPIENTDTPLVNVMMSVALLAFLEVLCSAAALKSRAVRRVASGTPRFVIHDGRVDQKELRALRWSIDDLMEQLRANGVFDIDEISFAVVETNGSISILQKYPHRPATCGDLGLTPPGCDAPPAIVISDGEIIPRALQYCNLTEDWLQKTLKKEGHAPQDIFLMSCSRRAHYKIVLKEKGG
jgi:uncharacterized membrane protein YcaP (DUF421 family)